MHRFVDPSSASSRLLLPLFTLILIFLSFAAVEAQTTNPHGDHTTAPVQSTTTASTVPPNSDITNLSPQSQAIVLNGTSIQRLKLVGSGPSWKEITGIGAVVLTGSDGDDRSKIASMNVRITNAYSEPTLLHTHGQTPNYRDDGVEYFSRAALKSGETLDMNFPAMAGTHFIHGHVGWHHDDGLAAPLIIRAPLPADYPNANIINSATDVLFVIEDVCLMAMDDNSTMGSHGSHSSGCADPTMVFKGLQSRWKETKSSFNNTQCQGGDLSKRWITGVSSESMNGGHSEMDVMYRYVAVNGRGIENPISVSVSPSQTIRLRIINSGSMMDFNVSFGSLPTPTVIAVDGHLIRPLRTNSLWLAVGQRADVIITIPENPASSYLIAAAIESGNEPAMQGGLVLYTTSNPPPPQTFPPISAVGSGFVTTSAIDFERDLRAWKPLTSRAADREYTIRMSGQYGFDSFSGDAQPYLFPPLLSDAYAKNSKPIKVKEGERVCINFVNFNKHTHPMHLHGHVFQVTEINGQAIDGAVRDTVLVGGGCQSTKVCFDAVNPGIHALHCHMSFHMMAGMFTTVEYEDAQPNPHNGHSSAATASWMSRFGYFAVLSLVAINILNLTFLDDLSFDL